MKIYKTKRRLLRSRTKAVSVLLTGSIAVTLLCGCSFDNPWDESVEGGDDNVFLVDKAYVSVNLISDGNNIAPVRTSRTTNNMSNENAVSNAYFYFYDSEGVFVVQGEITPSSSVWSDPEEGNAEKIEIQSSALVILKGLTGKEFPNYVVTVLNQPNGFGDPPTYLSEMETILSQGNSSGIYDSGGNFVMTTASYYGANHKYSFATEIGKENFILGEPSTDMSTVEPSLNINVERLAAKVTVKLNEDFENSASTYEDDEGEEHEIYMLPDQIKVNNENVDAYVELLGWKLDCVARNSYMFKNLDTSWNESNPWTGWNDASNFRSYWGKSYNYGADKCAEYPTSAKKDGNEEYNTWTEESSEDNTEWLNDYLEYVNLQDDEEHGSPLIAIGDSTYCAENTNTAGDGNVVQDSISSALTGVLVKARLCDVDGNTIEPVGYNGGMMYYYAPINHLRHKIDGENELLQAGTLNEGDFGVLRNHSYRITIKSLLDVGTGISDLDEVIIPGDQDYTTGFTSVALPWIVEEEDVDTGKNLDNQTEDGKGYIDVTK